MKKVLSVILLAGMFSGAVVAAGTDAATLTAMAQKGSGATLDKLSLAVYEAVKAQPDKAVKIFRGVISQRSSWSVTETYAVLRAVLLAAPGLEADVIRNAEVFQSGNYSAGAVDTPGCQLLASLYTMPQTQPVATAVIQGVIGSATTNLYVANGVSRPVVGAYVPVTSTPAYPVTPTPPPTSSNN